MQDIARAREAAEVRAPTDRCCDKARAARRAKTIMVARPARVKASSCRPRKRGRQEGQARAHSKRKRSHQERLQNPLAWRVVDRKHTAGRITVAIIEGFLHHGEQQLG